jgi:formylglycine-generating enzyme required for sulfatase activity
LRGASQIIVGLLASIGTGACSTGGSAGPKDGGPDAGPGGSNAASCVGLPATCGGSKDCCVSNVVTGGTFNRSNDAAFPATVSDFRLDVYEVTVGRFRAFVAAGKGTQANPPSPGDGAHPKIASSGWDPAFNADLPATTDALKAELKCDAAFPAWTDAPSGNETRPINCVTWFEAFAFCAWDGGRLPTEAEWNYAAAGGSEQREYPWGAAIDQSKASYNCHGAGAGACVFADMLPVGSKSPQGDGRWGQADLAGNVWEYTLDYSAVPYRLNPCTNCADLRAAPYRTFRGGGFANDFFYETTSIRLERSPKIADYDVGIRCARSTP